jgi:hypothetical protein
MALFKFNTKVPGDVSTVEKRTSLHTLKVRRGHLHGLVPSSVIKLKLEVCDLNEMELALALAFPFLCRKVQKATVTHRACACRKARKQQIYGGVTVPY